MGDEHTSVSEFKKFFNNINVIGRIGNHFVSDARKFNDFFAYFHMRIDKGAKCILYFTAANKQSADFGNSIVCAAKPCCFDVKHDKFAVKLLVAFAVNSRNGIVNKICLTTIYRLYILTRFFQSVNGFHNLGERLNNAVIGNCNRFMSPIGSSFYKVRSRCKCVHLRHIGM